MIRPPNLQSNQGASHFDNAINGDDDDEPIIQPMESVNVWSNRDNDNDDDDNMPPSSFRT
jgi:hypothetical protein